MARQPRSRKATLLLCMEMYEWIRDNPNSYKDDWPRVSEFKNLSKYNLCFCCMYAKYDCIKKCPLTNFAWRPQQSMSIALCTLPKSLYVGVFCGNADKIVWACYVALNEISPEEFPL